MCIAILTIYLCVLCRWFRWLNFVNSFLCIYPKRRNAKFNGSQVRRILQFRNSDSISFSSHANGFNQFARICAVTNVITQIERNKKKKDAIIKLNQALHLNCCFSNAKGFIGCTSPNEMQMFVCIQNAISSLNYEEKKNKSTTTS